MRVISMNSPVNPFMAKTFAPPVMEARNWLIETKMPKNLKAKRFINGLRHFSCDLFDWLCNAAT